MEIKTKKFESPWEDKPPIVYRPGTADEGVIATLLIDQKDYLFPNFKPAICWDIGAHIGVAAAIMANVYPEAKILCFEPEPLNFDILEQNTKFYKNIKIYDSGLGDKTCSKVLYKSDDPMNTGGFSTHLQGTDGAPHDEVSILRVRNLIEQMGCPEFIKIDCEGSEYEILNDIPELEKVKFITGELHGVNDFALLGVLEKHFKLQFGKAFDSRIWHFSARSKYWEEASAENPTPLPGPQS